MRQLTVLNKIELLSSMVYVQLRLYLIFIGSAPGSPPIDFMTVGTVGPPSVASVFNARANCPPDCDSAVALLVSNWLASAEQTWVNTTRSRVKKTGAPSIVYEWGAVLS
jgi:hypothetical protein